VPRPKGVDKSGAKGAARTSGGIGDRFAPTPFCASFAKGNVGKFGQYGYSETARKSYSGVLAETLRVFVTSQIEKPSD
jgi:hypothetical protein